eukprot:3841186-Amphidinium_carterae.1
MACRWNQMDCKPIRTTCPSNDGDHTATTAAHPTPCLSVNTSALERPVRSLDWELTGVPRL